MDQDGFQNLRRILNSSPATPSTREGFEHMYRPIIAAGLTPEPVLRGYIRETEASISEMAGSMVSNFKGDYRMTREAFKDNAQLMDTYHKALRMQFIETADIDITKLDKRLTPLEAGFVQSRVKLARYILDHDLMSSTVLDAPPSSNWAKAVIQGRQQPDTPAQGKS